jgi:zinc protease
VAHGFFSVNLIGSLEEILGCMKIIWSMAMAGMVVAGMGVVRGGASPSADGFFPYKYSLDTFPNGLRLITVPTDYPNLAAVYIVVRTGSRNEIEPGKSGFAHFFEHMMFRGSEHYTPDQRDAILRKAGAEVNAYTSDDRTVYHQLFAKENLEDVFKLEADRFQHLKYSEGGFKTEALAVLGEYNKNNANPMNKLEEVTREKAFDTHTYKHTTMGFLKDIENMPNEYAYSLEFYSRYYRPEYATILVVGDVKRDKVKALAEKYFGDWKRGNYDPPIPLEPPQKGPRTAHVDWPSPTLPYLVVAFHGPAYSDEKKDKAALDFLEAVAFGEDSELYQKLVLKEQKVDVIEVSFGDQKDPELFAVTARVKDGKDVEYVRDQILATFEKYTKELIPAEKLADTRSRLKYGTALGWNSSEAIANYLAPYLALAETPETVNKLFRVYEAITPEDVREMAKKYFVESGRTIVTLATKKGEAK